MKPESPDDSMEDPKERDFFQIAVDYEYLNRLMGELIADGYIEITGERNGEPVHRLTLNGIFAGRILNTLKYDDHRHGNN
jgi:hypothetical protein